MVISTQKQRVISTQVIQLFSPRVAPHIVAQHLGVAAKMTMKSLENCALHRSKRLNNEFVPLKFLDTSILWSDFERLKKIMLRHASLKPCFAMSVKKIVARINSFRHKKLLMILCPPLMCNCHAGPVVPTWIPDGYVLKVIPPWLENRNLPEVNGGFMQQES